MSKEFNNYNRGALFKNTPRPGQKYLSDAAPEYRGKLNAYGEDFYVSAWLRVSRSGEKFLSLALTPVNHGKSVEALRGGNSPEQGKSVKDSPHVDEDLPF